MEKVKLAAKKREEFGRGAVRRARRMGQIPGVVYGESGSHAIYLDDGELRTVLRKIVGAATIVNLSVDGREVASLVAAYQRHPIHDGLLHVDFHEISMKKKMHAQVPVRLIGVDECVGVKLEAGVLEFLTHALEVRCLPRDLPAECAVDVAGLHVGQIIHVKDLPSLNGVEFLGSPDLVIASCNIMKAAIEAEGAASGEATAADAKPAEKGEETTKTSTKTQ
jgi:large subunit ribosomal protein L25